jgi:hypothetical protein
MAHLGAFRAADVRPYGEPYSGSDGHAQRDANTHALVHAHSPPFVGPDHGPQPPTDRCPITAALIGPDNVADKDAEHGTVATSGYITAPPLCD